MLHLLRVVVWSWICCVAPVSAQAQGLKELNFGIISTEAPSHLKENWQPVIDGMQKRTGIKINPYFASSCAGIIEAMRCNKEQVAWHGNKAAMEAVDRANGEVFAVMPMIIGTVSLIDLLSARIRKAYL